MLTLLITFLTSLAPLLIKAGSLAIDLFVTDAQKRADAKAAFLGAIQSHINDALTTVQDRKSYQDQLDQLNKETNNAPPTA